MNKQHTRDETKDLDFRATDSALDVFRHPYASAGARRPELLVAA